jgi:hypothetical protein
MAGGITESPIDDSIVLLIRMFPGNGTNSNTSN